MTKERLQEIKDSINFQLEAAEHIKADSVIECLNEEKELFNYVIELENMREEIREYIKNNKIKISIKRGSEYAIPIEEIEDILNKTNKE